MCVYSFKNLKFVELLLGAWRFGVFDHVEPHGLGQRSALANGHNVAQLDVTEAGREVGGHVLEHLSFSSLFLSKNFRPEILF